MEDKWIRLVDEADYNLSEIMRDYHCSLEESQVIAEELFRKRAPRKTIYNEGGILDTEYDIPDTGLDLGLTVPFKPEEIIDINEEYTMQKVVSLIDSLKEMKSQNNIESIFIDKDGSVTIKF